MKKRQILIVLAFWSLLRTVWPAAGTNLMLNGSFEVGTYGWTWEAMPLSVYPESRLHVSMDCDTPTAGPELGTASLKIGGDKGLYSASLGSAMVVLSPARNYTFSFYAKASATMEVGVRALAPALGGAITLIDRKVSVGKEWQRFSFRFDADVLAGKRGEAGIHSQMERANVFRTRISMPYSMSVDAVVWLDGVQLAPGELAEYDDDKPVLTGPESTKYDNTYAPGENIDPVFYFYRSSAEDKTPYQARWQTEECLTGNAVGEATVPVVFEPGKRTVTQAFPYPVTSERQGTFKTTVTLIANNRELGYAEYVHAVYQPLPVPPDFDDDSLFAADILWQNRASWEWYYKKASEMGVRTYRHEHVILADNPEPGKFRWDSEGGKWVLGHEELWELAQKYKIRPMALIGPYCIGAPQLPRWMFTDTYSKSPSMYEGHDPENGKILPRHQAGASHDGRILNLELLGDYCYELAKHFKGRYKCYEIFNENAWVYEYPDYLKAAYQAIKRADPDALVLPNVSIDPDNPYIRRLRDTGALTKCCDGVSVHFGFNDPDSRPEYERHEEAYEVWKGFFGKMNPVVWDTEGRTFCSPYYTYMQPNQRGKETRQSLVNQAMRAQRLAVMRYDIGYGRWFHFTFAAYTGGTDYRVSLLEFNDTPRLAYVSMGNAARLLTGSKSLGKIKLSSDQLRGYQFRMKNGERFVTLWNVEEKPAEFVVEIPASELRAEDMLGNPLGLKGENGKTVVPIGGAPVYVFGRDKGEVWPDAAKVAAAFAQGEVIGLTPIDMAMQLAQNPETGKPALAVLAKNIGLREFSGVFQTSGLPDSWKTGGDRIGISGIAPGGMGVGYLDLEQLAPSDKGVTLKAFYQYGDGKIEASHSVQKVALVAKAKAAITIDGRLDDAEWKRAGDGFVVNRDEQVAYEREEGTFKEIRLPWRPAPLQCWKGPEDFSSIHKVLWDKDALYIGSSVRTRHLVQIRTNPDRIYDSSCIELFFSMDPVANAWDTHYAQSDYHLLLTPATEENPTCLSLALRGRKNEKFNLDGLEVRSRPVTGGYEMEIKLPWNNFPEMAGRAAAGRMMGMDISVDSPFADGNRQWQMAWSGDGNNCDRTDLLAKVLLAGETTVASRSEDYLPAKPFSGGPIKVSCDQPGVYAIKWHYKTERPESLWSRLNFEEIGRFAGGPLGVGTDPNDGLIRINTAFGFANRWTEGLYYFTVLKSGTYDFSIGCPGAPGVQKVLIDSVSTGMAGEQDYHRLNLLADGSFEDGCADFWAPYAMLKARERGWDWFYALDTQEFCHGRQSLRMSCSKGDVGLYSRPIPVITGKRYRLEAMVKQADAEPKPSAQGLTMDLWPYEPRKIYDEWRYAIDYSSAGFAVDDKWKRIACTLQVKQWGQNQPTTCAFRLRAQTPGTYWVDDVRIYLDEGGAPGQAGRDVIAEKLVIKTGETAGKYAYALADNADPALLAAFNDAADYVEGRSSLRLENRAPTVAKESGVDIPVPNALTKAVLLDLRCAPFTLEPDRTYRMAFWARCDLFQSGYFGGGRKEVSVWLAIEPAGYKTEPITDQFYQGRPWPYEQVVHVTPEWKKYEISFIVPNAAQGPFTQLIRFTDKANLWLDDLHITPATRAGTF